jgi:hypothetical protein
MSFLFLTSAGGPLMQQDVNERQTEAAVKGEAY